MPTSAVVDTSVLVSAFLFPESVPGRVAALADQDVDALHFSAIILEETRRSLRNPRLRQSYNHTDEAIDAWRADLPDIGSLLTTPLPDIGSVCRAPDDDHVIAAALAAGPVSVERHLYRPSSRSSKSICPLELRAGIVSGLFTPRAARHGAFALAHMTPREVSALFLEFGGMQPSVSTLDRLPKVLSSHFEANRETWEATMREAEMVSREAAVVAVSLDG